MKKRWIPVILLLTAATFITGLRIGAQREAANHHPQNHHRAQADAIHHNTTIAVVNADTGAAINGARYNYSAAIINTLSADFELVSPAMAQTGLANGTYGAIITFPPETTQRILSFNAQAPQRVQLDFQISHDLPEREFLETYITITELQLAINTTLAGTYVSSILRQFHQAQDQVDGVFRNSLADLMALEIITLADFTATLTLDEVPQIPLVPRELDNVFYMEQVQSFAQEVSSWYRNSYAMASDQFLWMREGLFALTADFPEQENQWMEMLYLWTGYSIEYGELLEQYSAYVRAHEEALAAWHEENVTWNQALEDYQLQVEDWHQDSNFWFEDAYQWHIEYLGFLDEAMEYFESLEDFHQELEDNVNALQDDLTSWKDVLIQYEEWLADRVEELREMTELYNYQAQIANDFNEDLLDWHTRLDYYVDALDQWNIYVEDRLDEMHDWQDSLNSVTTQFQIIINNTNHAAASLPLQPSLPPQQPAPGNLLTDIIIPLPIPSVPQLTISGWQPPVVDAPQVYIPPSPGLTGNTFHDAQALAQWYGQLQAAASGLGVLQSSLQGAIPALESRQAQLSSYYASLVNIHAPLQASQDETRIWYSSLMGVYSQMFMWDSELRQHSQGMVMWFNEAEDFVASLAVTQFPALPGYVQWQHIAFPGDMHLLLPDQLEMMEMIDLPDWEEYLPAPAPYDGTQVVDAFNIEFPLQGNAIEPMYLERPAAFANYTIPQTVDYHEWLTAIQPLNPQVAPPPRPDNFWSSLDFMHSQLSSFDVGEFLSDDILRMVDQSLNAYDVFLQALRYEISFLFQDNIWLMYDIHAEYEDFLFHLRHNALDANWNEQQALQDAIATFAVAREDTHDDNIQRLAGFASMMPESRAAAGVSQDLVDFAVMPLYFAPLSLRSIGPAAHDAAFGPAQANTHALYYTLQRYQIIALVALCGVFAGTVISSLVSRFGRKKREEAEARGYM